MIEIMTLFGPEEVETKECNKCGRDLPYSCYSPSNGGNYTRAECKECAKGLSKQIKEYKNIPIPKNYKCPICLKKEEQCRGLGGKKVGTWCVDHDHKTGEFRGWLCHACNRTIGNFHDDIEKMKRAINYIEGKDRIIIKRSIL